jgi:hypothetical protein
MRAVKRFLFVGLLALMATGCSTLAKKEYPLECRVVRVKGKARWRHHDGESWKEVKSGKVFEEMAPFEIQTASRSWVTMWFDSPCGSGPRDFDPAGANVIHLREDSWLVMERLRSRFGFPRHEPMASRMRLLRGELLGQVRSLGADFDYQVAFTNGVASTRDGAYRLTASGDLRVMTGQVTVVLYGTNQPITVGSRQVFSALTGQMATLPPPTHFEPFRLAREEPPRPPWPPWPKRAF